MNTDKDQFEAYLYIREKINQLLDVMGTYPLKPEELDDKTLIELDPIGIIASSFKQILKHHEETIAELEFAKNEIRTVFNSIHASIMVIDQDMCIQDFNQNAKDYFFPDKSDEEIFDHSIRKVCSFDTKFTDSLNAAADKSLNLLHNKRNFTVTVNKIGNSNNKKHLSIINFHDITEQKTIELELNRHRNNLEELVYQRTEAYKDALEQAESANRAKSEFLSRMSHELRTPLNAILGFGQILELDEEVNKNHRTHVKEILDAGYHLLDLINDVLDLSIIESGKLEIKMEKTPVSKIIESCLSLIHNQAEQRKIKITDNISKHNYQIEADPTRFKQVLLNLLSNAVKYNREKGYIILDAETLNDKQLKISVTDNGEGFNKKQAESLFIPFERIKTKTNIEGTGIGLVITRYMTELMGGKISYDSIPGKGTTFSVSFNLAEN